VKPFKQLYSNWTILERCYVNCHPFLQIVKSVADYFFAVEFQLPNEECLPFDDDMWVCALNNGSIAESEVEEDLQLKTDEAKIASWHRMFDLSFPRSSSGYWNTLNEKYICAAYSKLTSAMVKNVSEHHGEVLDPQRVFYNKAA